MKFAAFDLEIAKDLPENEKWQYGSLLGITCAAVAFSDNVEPIFWTGVPKMTRLECQNMFARLKEIADSGYTFVTWNGCAFDFAVLAEETGLIKECGEFALQHVDLMLVVTFTKGWYLGLQKALLGAGLKGKRKTVTLSDGTILDEMGGIKAPKMWADGEFDAVLSYLKDDVVELINLVKVISKTKEIRWTSDKGKFISIPMPYFPTVLECFDIPEPDVSWMTDPPTRKQFVEWISSRNIESDTRTMKKMTRQEIDNLIDKKITDLSGLDLSGLDLSRLDLSGLDLSGSNLSKTDLLSADLNGDDLSGADLRGAELSVSYEEQVVYLGLRNANLKGARYNKFTKWPDGFDPKVAVASFKIGQEELTKLINTKTKDLRGLDLRNTNLSGADLNGAVLFGANLSEANLRKAILGMANLIGAILRRADLRGADLHGADLREADLSGADLSGVDLSGANLSKANLDNASLGKANLSGADLGNAVLINAFLLDANLSGAYLNGANLINANLSDADLSMADLSGTNYLSGAYMDNAKYSKDTIWPDGFDPKAHNGRLILTP